MPSTAVGPELDLELAHMESKSLQSLTVTTLPGGRPSLKNTQALAS